MSEPLMGDLRLRSLLLAMALGLVAAPAAALDCAAVAKLSAEGKDPRDVAMALSVTTPQVEECLANPALPESPPNPGMVDGEVARDQQLESDIPDSGPLWDQE